MRICGSQSPKQRTRSLLTLAGLAACLAPFPGCVSVTGTPSLSQIRIIDASPSSQGLDVYQGTSVLAYNLGLGTVTSYVPITPGTYNILADNAGTHQQVASAAGTFLTNAQYTVLIGGYTPGLQELILRDQAQAAPVGQISLRVLDQADQPGPVDLYFVAAGSTLVATHPFLTNVVFGSNTGYLTLPAGTYTLIALPAGTTPTATGSTYYTGAAVQYNSGVAKTLVLIDQQGTIKTGLQVISASDYDPLSASS